MYLAMDIRPDLAFTVMLVLRFTNNLHEAHIKAVKKILCYLQATTNIGLNLVGVVTNNWFATQMPTTQAICQEDVPHPDTSFSTNEQR